MIGSLTLSQVKQIKTFIHVFLCFIFTRFFFFRILIIFNTHTGRNEKVFYTIL